MKKTLLPLTETAILIALAAVLELVFKNFLILKMPQGGSVSIAMLPIMLVGFRHGVRYGFAAGLCFAVINFIFDGLVWHWGSIIFDYLLAFVLLGVTGFFKNKANKYWFFLLGILLACTLRYLMHSFSGVLFFGEYAPEKYQNAVWLYSFIIYNLGYNAVSTALSMAIGSICYPFIIKKNPQQ